MYRAIVFIWILMEAFVTTMGCLSSDIINGVCIPWGVFSSNAAQKIISTLLFTNELLLPLVLIVFCYTRIIYALKHKVNSV